MRFERPRRFSACSPGGLADALVSRTQSPVADRASFLPARIALVAASRPWVGAFCRKVTDPVHCQLCLLFNHRFSAGRI
jgi:hypothetical protein